MSSHRATPLEVLAGIVLASGMFACGDSPPGPGGPTGPIPDVRLEIVGPESIAQGQSAQYTARSVSPAGSSAPAFNVVWSSGQPALFTVNPMGVVTAGPLLRGEAGLQVQLEGDPSGRTRATRTLMVMPAGTYRLLGTVTETGTNGYPIWGARVEAAPDSEFSGPLMTFATSGPDGRFKLYGVPPDPHFRVQRDGYTGVSERLELRAHGSRNVELRIEQERVRLEGDYWIVVEAGSCHSKPLRDDLRRRTYEGTIRQNGPALTVSLTAPRFLVSGGLGNRFGGMASGNGATFEMSMWGDPYWGATQTHPDVAELLPDGTVLAINGRASLTGTSEAASGTMSGYMGHYGGGMSTHVADCSTGRMTLTRR